MREVTLISLNIHLLGLLPGRRLVWSDMIPVDITAHWREDWSTSVVNHATVTDPPFQQSGFYRAACNADAV